VDGGHALHERRVIDGKDVCDVLDDFVERAGAVMKSLGAALRDMKRQYKSLCQFMSFVSNESAETFEIFEIIQRFNAEVVKQHKTSVAEAAAAAERARKEQAAALQKVAARARASSRASANEGGGGGGRRSSMEYRLDSTDSTAIRDATGAPPTLTSLDLARPIPADVPLIFRKRTMRRESFCVAPPAIHPLPTCRSVDDISLAFHPHSLVARIAAATVECIPLSERGVSVVPSRPNDSDSHRHRLKAASRFSPLSPLSAFAGPSPHTRISGRRSSVRPVDVATQRATLDGMKGKKVRSALKGQLMQDIVGSVLTEIKLKRGSKSLLNKVTACLLSAAVVRHHGVLVTGHCRLRRGRKACCCKCAKIHRCSAALARPRSTCICQI